MGRHTRSSSRQDFRQTNDKQFAPTYQCVNGIVLTVRDENLVRVDLHGKKTTDVREMILRGISDAQLKSASIVEIIHGYNRGGALKKATENELVEIKQSKLIKDFYPSPCNHGSTIVHLD